MIGSPRYKAIRIAKGPWIGPGFITSSESGEVQIGAAEMAGWNPIEQDGGTPARQGGRRPGWWPFVVGMPDGLELRWREGCSNRIEFGLSLASTPAP